jgi:CDP-diacylglycerol--glycerol-3-phosphate 3-phosphatidyltransferase
VTGGPRPEPFGLGWPNVISIVRLLLLPIIVLLLLRETDATDVAAAAVFAVGAFTDRLDGYLARRFDQRTATGAWLDPLSDKIYVVVPAVALSMLGRFPWWVTVVFAVREAAVTWLRWRLDKQGRVSMPASGPAKLKTLSQLVAVGGAMLPLPGWLEAVETALILISAALTIYTGAEYFLTTRHRRAT